MTIPKVERSLGKSYPTTPDELVTFVQRVMGPIIQEQRDRWNKLDVNVGFQMFETVADMQAFDTTDVGNGYIAIVTEDREIYSLDKTGTAVAGMDPAATPLGCWDFEWSL
jgi:hypothetical protein